MSGIVASGRRHVSRGTWLVWLLAMACAAPAAAQDAGEQPPEWLGICSVPLSTRERTALNNAAVKGAVVVGVYPGGPGDAAGLRQGDIIVEINDNEIPSVERLAMWKEIVGKKAPTPDNDATVVYDRDGTRWRVTLTPTTPPKDLAAQTRKLAEQGFAWAQYELAQQLRRRRGRRGRSSHVAQEGRGPGNGGGPTGVGHDVAGGRRGRD